MDDHLLLVFKIELKSQLELAAIAADDFEAATSGKAPGTLWYALQGILVTAGNASKLLWGSSGKDKQERERKPLRDLAGVGDDSPLRSRKVRNAFEHFDEHIEAWAQGDTKLFSSRSVGRVNKSVVVSWPPPTTKRFGNYDPKTGVLTFWDRSVSIPDLIAEMDRIWMRLWPNEDRGRGPVAPDA
jgi:hypothetical protein